MVELKVFAEPLVISGRSYLPRDLDGDGNYLDVTGDGALSREDVTLYSQLRDAIDGGFVTLTGAQQQALDYNDDGILNGRDQSLLAIEVFQR
jgi:hypothetical protein